MYSVVRNFLFFCLIFASSTSFAQGRSSFRTVLSKIHVSTSVGYGRTQYSYLLTHAAGEGGEPEVIMSKQGEQFYLHPKDSQGAYLIHWFESPDEYIPEFDVSQSAKAKGMIAFEGCGLALPISLATHVDLWGKMRVGLGGSFLINRLEQLNPQGAGEELGAYRPKKKWHYYLRPFCLLGYKLVENSIISMLLDFNLGYDFMHSFDNGFVDFLNLGVKNMGLTVEGHISKDFRLFGRISCERSDRERLFGSSKGSKTGMTWEHKSILVQIGLSFNYPEYPRCPLVGCKIERKHKHGGKDYRGVSIFTTKDAQGQRIHKK